MNFKQKGLKAFTLAETLIVMGIIGVVAALTIPNLTQSTGEKEKIAKLQKLYSNLEDAFGRATAVYGPMEEWFINDTNAAAYNKRFGDRILEFMKVTKNCGTSTNGTCFADGRSKTLDGVNNTNYNTSADILKAILADGSSIAFTILNPACTTNDSDGSADSPYKNTCGSIYVDIDGPKKGPYTHGKDFFVFTITKTGIYPKGGRTAFLASDLNLKGNCFVYGHTCTGWIIENGNMDYLKVDSSGKCPNGTVLNWTNTSCK